MTKSITPIAAPYTPPRSGLLNRVADFSVRRRWVVLLVTFVLVGGAAAFGSGVIERLSNGGYVAETDNLRTARGLLQDRFAVTTPHLLLVLHAPSDLDDLDVAAAGRAYTERVSRTSGVASALSYWTTGDQTLRSQDGRSAVVAVRLAGDDDQAQRTAKRITPEFTGPQQPFEVRATGEALANAELQEQSDKDLARAELLAAPLIILILLLVFRTPLAAILPFMIGVIGIVLTLAVLRLVSVFSDVSIFALNLTTALGLGLAIDYSLFILMRFREEVRRGHSPRDAVVVTVRTAGRTVFFSALTVGLCLSALLVFPLYFLRSLAYAAIPVVLLVGAAAIIVLPAVLLVTGRWLDVGDITSLIRRLTPSRNSSAEPFWARLGRKIMRRPIMIATPVVVLLVVLALPFTQAQFGLTDERVLPPNAESYQTGRIVERDFQANALNPIHVVLRGGRQAELAGYVQRVSSIPGVQYVDSAAGRYMNGVRIATAEISPEMFTVGDTTRLNVVTGSNAYSTDSEQIVHWLRASDAPGEVFVAGSSALFADTKSVIVERIPYALAIIVLAMFGLLFLFTGSLLVPIKALIFNTLSLTASFGAIVYIFQDGHLKGLVGDFVTTGYLDVTVPVLMFCVAFGLSMDYEVFLLARIREQYLRHGDNARAVTEGLGATGPLISAAALLIGVVLVVLATSEISVLKLLGVGLFLAVLVDAVLIRGVLVPAFMQVAGKANWWAPRPLRRIHSRLGIKE